MTSRHLFDKIDNFLYEEKKEQEPIISCCDDEENIRLSSGLQLYVCGECGNVKDEIVDFVDDIEKYKNSTVIKTFVNYSYKYKNIFRLQKWTNWNYNEVELLKIQNYIEDLDIDIEVKRIAKILFMKYYIKQNIVSRNNIRRGLICLCIYKGYIYYHKDVNIDDLFKILNINFINYNKAVNKVSKDERIFYPRNIDLYLKIIDYKIEKNYLIRLFSYICNEELKFNKKTLLISLIYTLLDDNSLYKNNFFDKFDISRITVIKVSKLIKDLLIINKCR